MAGTPGPERKEKGTGVPMSSVVYSRARSTFLSLSFARSASPFRSTTSASAHLSMVSQFQANRFYGRKGTDAHAAQALGFGYERWRTSRPDCGTHRLAHGAAERHRLVARPCHRGFRRPHA